MSDFKTRYLALNDAQKTAVDTVDGPVMVVAGPGTGKTELLSMRVANILMTTDVLPQNILCLTYTESGAYAMRERLSGLIGNDAYKVAIHTFHSFGAEVINRYAEYFYHGAHFRPADELSSYEVLRKLFEQLPHDDPLASKMNDEFTYLRDTQSAISDLKKSGLTSDELGEILDRNELFLSWFQPRLQATLGERLSKRSLVSVDGLLTDLGTYTEQVYDLITYEPLHEQTRLSLEAALHSSEEDNSTKPLSAWKREWCEKREDGELTLKDAKRTKRLRSVARIYYSYLLAMQERSLFDFDDMILRTVHALEVFDDLRLNLQEQYQYILVDEFQDTNDAQMRLLWNLTNNALAESRPNIMVVGDDDQAIYRFQGATLSNILDFQHMYRDVSIIALTDNYRSCAPVLDIARSTIIQADERLENSIESLDKTLQPHHSSDDSTVEFSRYTDESSEYAAIASRIAHAIKTKPNQSIAVIARHHRQLQALLPFLQRHDIPLSYDRRDNVLESEPVQFMELLARVITLLAKQELEQANGLLPELLSHPAWNIPTRKLWELSFKAYRNRQFWLEEMLATDGQLSDIAEWLIYSAHLSGHEPLEYILDHLTGTVETQAADSSTGEYDADESGEASTEQYHSPLRSHFFSHDLLEQHPATYVAYLDALTAIRSRIRDYRPEGRLLLDDFVHCIDRYRQLGLSIQGTGHTTADSEPVELLTAHRSKGLEFDTVYVISLSDAVWGETSKSRGKLISYPHNLQIGISGDNSDERIRLLFVAMTRAKTNLFLSTHQATESGRAALPVGYLSSQQIIDQTDEAPEIERHIARWHSGVSTRLDHSLRELLSHTLIKYKLSATHLCNFLDVSRGGPELFLLQNLLRFPQAMGPSAAFGSAIHATLQRAHAHYTAAGKKRPVEDLLADFDTILSEYQLPRDQHEFYAKKGADVLSVFLSARYDSFSPSQRVEQSLGSDGIVLGDARLSGAIDLMDIDETTKTIIVTDYKTGKSVPSWKGRTEYEKIKLHHYRQQLMFYKLLIENSRHYAGYTVTQGVIEFVEPDGGGAINRIVLDYDADEIKTFTELLGSVWSRIQALNFEKASDYPPTLEGILAFEAEVTNPAVS